MHSRPVTTTRRAALGAAVGLAASATACTSGTESPGSAAGSPATSAPAVDTDRELVTETALLLATTQVLVDGLARDVPSMKAELRPFRRMHTAHLEALGGFDDPIPTPPPSSGRPTSARRELARSERALQRALVRAALDAESGALAKLLATMAAAVAQQLAVLR